MKILLAFLVCLAAPRAVLAQTRMPGPLGVEAPSCVAALDALQVIFRRDYPGYGDKVPGREAALAALTDSVRAVARTSDEYPVCIPALRRWIGFFRDPHMQIWQAAKPTPTPTTTGRSAVAAAPSAPPADDTLRPRIRWVDDSTAVIRVPDLSFEYKPAIDSLIAAHRVRLLATPYLVIDMRGNGGGYTGSYTSLVPLLYTGPIVLRGVDLWSSQGNRALLQEWIADRALPERLRRQSRAVLARAESNPGRFVEWTPDQTLRLDTVYPMPRSVAVLVDRGCASSCENFVQTARQSRKVTVIGPENTRGMGDYGNVHSVWLPGWRRVRLPSTRARSALTEPIDNVGIAPQVRIPTGESDAIAFAIQHLRSGAGSVRP